MSVVKYKDPITGEWKQMASANPVGIAKIEQTNVATEDNSENVIQITLTNGRAYEVTMRNGSTYVLTEMDKKEIAEQAVALVDEGLLAIIGTGEVTA